MDRIVSKGLKIDLHIHSAKSKFKEKGTFVDKGTLNNLPILIKKLIEHGVNMCSISDHDSFDFNLYSALKKEEGKGSIIKVFPAVEFTVSFSNEPNKPVHVICVFNDEDPAKIQNIELVLAFDENTKRPKYDVNDSFSENKFIELLSLIDLDVVCIAHQKNTLTSSQPRTNDTNALGDGKFNELLFSEYFEAFEFKNRKNQAFNNYSKSMLDDDLLRFITGSDCHQWSEYPKYSATSNDDDFKHTYLKCLPIFKGLALALTDDSRISLDDNFFTQSKFHLDSISLTVNKKEMVVPLSRGINVIIGDNSIGKSLLLHKMTDYRGTSITTLTKTVKDGYDNYLALNNLEIHTSLGQKNIFAFDMQGDIRLKFNQGKLKRDAFFIDKYPPDKDVSLIRNILVAEVNKVGDYLSALFEYNQKYDDLVNLVILKERETATSISVLDCPFDTFTNEETRLKSILSQISKAKTELMNLKPLLEEEEKRIIDDSINSLDLFIQKYEKSKSGIVTQLSLINCINNAFNDYNKVKTLIKTTADQNLETFIQQEKIFTDALVDLLYAKKGVTSINPHIDGIEIEDEKREHLNFAFIKRTNVQKFDNHYLDTLLNKPFNKTKRVTYKTAKKLIDFKEHLKDYDDAFEPIEFYKNKIIEQIDKDLQQKAIPNKIDEKGKYMEYSSGLNSQIYFEVLSLDRYKDGVYLIDQPEDDVSPKSIKGHLLKNFKDMGKNRQVILVTHNPQFVVNLDVDNVIIMTKDENNFLKIESGALEYQDSETNVLNQIATLLDSGIETIRKRWKRYEKVN